jgi:sulfatase modifying factor 1
MRHVMIRTTLVGLLMMLTIATSATSTPAGPREALEAEARRHGAPMVWIADGAFAMGAADGPSKSRPVRQVYLYAFYMEQYEVTTARYAKFLEAMKPQPPGFVPMFWEQVNLASDGDRPVMGVTWKAADAFCRWLGKRLPTEAEWEKAARGPDGRTYPWGNAEPSFKLANYDQALSGNLYGASLRPVGSYEDGKSPYGVYDMAGSVSEWVADWYDEAYYPSAPEGNPKGPTQGRQKVLRGGSFGDSAESLTAISRESYFPEEKGPYVGIRCALDSFAGIAQESKVGHDQESLVRSPSR